MLFNSLEFIAFFSIFLLLYWNLFSKNIEKRNIYILLSSYIFYGFWDWRFLVLICISTLVDYFAGLKIAECKRSLSKKKWLFLSLFVNLGLLAVFKYYNFFIESWVNLLRTFGYESSPSTLYIILPVGISFYTFQSLSYTLDIYKGQLQPTRNIVTFAGFVSFFPQLVAGPIERASKLLPQFATIKTYNPNGTSRGLELIIWGLFKKVVIADNVGKVVDYVFADINAFPAPIILLAIVFFSIQIYCDFSGYSDIAIGTARMMGFRLSRNFRLPYIAQSLSDFWRRWHISLSSWFRDYLYIVMGGNRGSAAKKYLNILVTFLASGLWHGANFTFVIWGGVHGIFLVIEDYLNKFRINSESGIVRFFRLVRTYAIVTLLWGLFRIESHEDILPALNKIFTFNYLDFVLNIASFGQGNNLLGVPWITSFHFLILMLCSTFCAGLIEYNTISRTKLYQDFYECRFTRDVFRLGILSITLILWGTEASDFIYFQF